MKKYETFVQNSIYKFSQKRLRWDFLWCLRKKKSLISIQTDIILSFESFYTIALIIWWIYDKGIENRGNFKKFNCVDDDFNYVWYAYSNWELKQSNRYSCSLF